MDPHSWNMQAPPVISGGEKEYFGVGQRSQSPPPRRGKFRILLILAVGLGLVWIVLLLKVVGSVLVPRSIRPGVGEIRLREYVIEPGPVANRIAVIRVEGIITRSYGSGVLDMVDLIKAQLDAAGKDASIRAVILSINSPGGEALAADMISSFIKNFQERTGKPVIAQMGSIAASGGYYIAAPCRWIVAHKMTLTGSIGVIFGTVNYRGLMDKLGLRPMIYKRGQFKDMLSGMREPDSIKPEEEQMVISWLDEVYEQFKSVVRQGRNSAFKSSGGRALSENWEEFADGRILSGQQAYELGFVDELGDFQVAVARAKKFIGVTEAEVFEYRPRFGLLAMIGLESLSQRRSITLDLGIKLPKLEPGKVYFLPPPLFGSAN